MLDSGHPHGCWQRGLGGVNQVVDENIFLSCLTSFRPSFDGKSIKSDFRYLRDMLYTLTDVDNED